MSEQNKSLLKKRSAGRHLDMTERTKINFRPIEKHGASVRFGQIDYFLIIIQMHSDNHRR